MLASEHLASCLMPTRNRRRFVGRAVRCFLEQSWWPRELIVLDDGEDAVADAIPNDPCVRYVRAPAMSLGDKMARLARMARGDVLAIWDDDDWHGPRRLEVQAPLALATGACVLDRVLAVHLGGGPVRMWASRGLGAIVDGTLVFSRAWYASGPPFRPATHQNQELIKARSASTLSWADGSRLYAVAVHGDNTATRVLVEPFWRVASAEDDAFASNALGAYA